VDLKDQWVNFRIRDVYIPEPQKLLTELHGNDILQGRVVAFSDNEMHDGCFVVLEVEGIREPLVVPMKKVLSVL
jgi:hypothetical protein